MIGDMLRQYMGMGGNPQQRGGAMHSPSPSGFGQLGGRVGPMGDPGNNLPALPQGLAPQAGSPLAAMLQDPRMQELLGLQQNIQQLQNPSVPGGLASILQPYLAQGGGIPNRNGGY